MRYMDSHTEGEPTRVILEGAPDLGEGSVAERLRVLREQHDEIRRFSILEPRGYDALVGALLLPAADPTCLAGVIFFNNTGYLGMCGHASIGVAATLAFLGHVDVGVCRLETPVGVVEVEVQEQNYFAVTNVASCRYRKAVSVKVESLGVVTGDIAWGGNWFFLTDPQGMKLQPEEIPQLLEMTSKIRAALQRDGITGEEGAEIDHIELTGPAPDSDADSRNFVLCPGGEYDRSPCGTGTSAKLACLAADRLLEPGKIWTQESVIGSQFQASYHVNADGQVIPRISGRAFITGQGVLLSQPEDPFAQGLPG